VRLALGVAAAALLVAASGCGGDDDGDAAEDAARSNPGVAVTRTVEQETTEPVQTRPEPSATQSRWAAAVDDACRPLQERLDALPQPADAASLQAWLGQAIPIVREQIAAVKAVEPASGPAGRAQGRFVASLERLERALTRYREGLAEGNVGKVEQAVADATEAGADARAQATKAGVTQCGGYER
jgi:hypothetical protein